jgi:hypothetical protein
MNHNKVDQQLGGYHRTKENQMIPEQSGPRPSLHPNIHHLLVRYQGKKFVFLLPQDGEYQNQGKQNLLVTSPST